MIIHGSGLVAVAQGLVEYWDSRWIFSALRHDLKILSTTPFAQSPCAASGSEEKGRRGLSFYDKVLHHFPTHVPRFPPVWKLFAQSFVQCVGLP